MHERNNSPRNTGKGEIMKYKIKYDWHLKVSSYLSMFVISMLSFIGFVTVYAKETGLFWKIVLPASYVATLLIVLVFSVKGVVESKWEY